MDSENSHPSFPFRIEPADQETKQKYPDAKTCVFVGNKKYCLPSTYKSVASKLYNFEVRPDDVWILGPPGSGTSLTSEIVWLLENDLDYQQAAKTVMEVRLPLLEGAACFHKEFEKIRTRLNPSGKSAKVAEALSKPAWETFNQTARKRFFRTHLPLSLAPSDLLTSGCKVLYVARNPKDVCVSCYFLMKNFETLCPDVCFEEYWNYFSNGLVLFTPFLDHVKEAWERRYNKNLLFLFYEDYVQDLKDTLFDLADFLEKDIGHDDLDSLMKHAKIQKNEEKLAERREYFGGYLAYQADKWMEENLKNTDLKFFE